jgi:inosine/xanthosine triphosphate pyrophosphatase family protein
LCAQPETSSFFFPDQEMSDEEKDARSHRGFAFLEFEKKVREYLKDHSEV